MKENGEEAPDGRKVLSIPEWQREILAERLRDLEANPDDQQDWEAVKAELWPAD